MIRAASVADIPAILAIWNPMIRDALITFNSVEKTADDLRLLLVQKAHEGHAFLVAERDGVAVGLATYGQFRSGLGYRHTVEHSIMPGDAARGQGLGRKLMQGVEQHAHGRGAHSIFAGVSAANPAGEGFHAAVGFHTVSRLAQVGWKFGKWWDLVLMQKFLT